jgi:hypothetical protein
MQFSTTSFTIGSKAYICGGGLNDHGSDIYEYDPSNDKWEYKTSLPHKLSRSMSFSIANKGYIVGGFTSSGESQEVYEYDPLTNTVRTRQNLPVEKADGVGFSIGTKGYIGLGGLGNTDYNGDFYEYDLGYTYVWNRAAATTTSITVSLPGNYNVTATSNITGCSAVSANTVVSVIDYPDEPVIAAGGPTSFCAGGSVTLSAPNGFTYLWSPGNQTTQSITISTAGSYTVKVTNATGCGTTSAATVVTINAPPAVPTITASGAATFCTGGSVRLSAPAGASSYQWKLNGSAISGGATTKDTTITAAGNYTVTVTNANGCASTSAATMVTVKALPAAAIITGATSVCSGNSTTLLARQTGTVCVTADEGSILNIQAPAGAKFTALVFASYGTPTGTCGNFVKSSCHAANSETFVSSQLLGNSQASIFASPSNFGDPCFGLAKKLYVEARYTYTDAIPTDTYLWSTTATTSSIVPSPTVATNYTVAVANANGCVGNANVNISILQPSSSTTNITICPANLPYSWNGQSFTTAGSKTATLVNVNAVGCDSLATLNLTVNTATAITSSTGSQAICAGGSASFTVAATGTSLTYQWFKNGTTLGVGFTEATLSFTNITAANAGSYTCTVTGSCGALITTAAVLTVNAVTAITTSPTSRTVCAGDNTSFTVAATGTGTLSYQWKRGSTDVGLNSAILSLTGVSAADVGSYTCVVTGTCGNATTTAAVLTVNAVTAITTSPTGQTVCAGGNASFTVAATGVGTLSYQWKRGSTDVGGNSATLSLTNVTAAEAGSYACVVTDTCGNATTTAAVLTVNAVTAITTSPTDQTVCAGGNTSLPLPPQVQAL